MRYFITVPLELSLNAENEKDARVELMKVRSEIDKPIWTEKGTINLRIRTDKAKVEKLAF